MSLLDKPGRENVIVYQEIVTTDADGNVVTKVGTVGTPTTATIQEAAQSGTSARRAEQDEEGYTTEKVLRIRFPRSFTMILGAQAQVEWEGVRYAVMGDVKRFNGSDRTKHNDYTLRRT
jgi:hypothetical protein